VSAPTSSLILADLATALTAIDGTGDWNHTLVGVDTWVREPRHLGIGELPRAMVAPHSSPETTEHHCFGVLTQTLAVTVIGVAIAPSMAARSDTAAKLDDDLTAAVLADPRRGGNAISTTVVDTQDDQSIPESDADGARVVVVKSLRIRYDRTSGLTAA